MHEVPFIFFCLFLLLWHSMCKQAMRSTNEEAGGAKRRGDERVRVPTIVITILSGCFDGQGGVDGTVPRASPRERRLVSKGFRV